jgi:hypothetical protein
MSVFMPRLVVLALCAALAGACGGGEAAPPAPTTPRTVKPAVDTVVVPPGGTGRLGWQVLGPSGAPLAGAVVTFAIVDDPQYPPEGASLVTASATTDGNGNCAAQLIAGQPTQFAVRATSADATADARVFVGGDSASVDVAPFFPTPAGAHAAVVARSVEILFFDNGTCAGIDLRHAPPPLRGKQSVPAPTAAFTMSQSYTFVRTEVNDAIVGRARDEHGGLRALGCVDLPGRALVPSGEVQVALPLVDAGPDPAGTYGATTALHISPPLAAAATIAAAFRDLTDCPLDPAQLWLDCTIDALGPADATDPLDCVPAQTPGGDGALGDALGALRGTFLAGPDGAPSSCRGPKAGGGATSADATVANLYGSPVPAVFVGLAAAAGDAPHLFDDLQLTSTLDVRAAETLGDVTITHTLTKMTFTLPSGGTDVSLVTLGLPVLSTMTTGQVTDDTLTIAQHGFTLRLGAAARAAFGKVSLAGRGLPADLPGVVATIAALAHSDDGKLAGCVALDDTLCPRVGRPAGCLVTACATGLNALAARLDASFAAADGTDLDLYLAGTAPLLETHDDDRAGRLGDLKPGAPPGTWTVDLRPRSGRRTLTASWEAIRN